MKYMRVWAIAFGMCLGISIVCGANNSIEVKKVAPNSPESKPLVLVSVPPLVQIVRAIAGDSKASSQLKSPLKLMNQSPRRHIFSQKH